MIDYKEMVQLMSGYPPPPDKAEAAAYFAEFEARVEAADPEQLIHIRLLGGVAPLEYWNRNNAV